MSIFVLTCFIIGGLAGSTGLFVFLNNRKQKINQLWCLLNLSVATWMIGLGETMIVSVPEDALFWQRILYVGTIFVSVLFSQFCLVFSGKEEKFKNLIKINSFIAMIFIFFLFFGNFLIQDVKARTDFGYWPIETGWLYYLFLIWFISNVIYAFYILKKCLDGEEPNTTKRKQITILYYGTLIGFISSSVNFLLDFNIVFPPFHNFLVGAYLIFTAFAVTKYHLFDIKVLLTELLVISMTVSLATLPFFMPDNSLRYLTLTILFFFVIFGWLLIKATYEEVRRKEEAERLLKAKTEFLSIASHQLRTPLTAIIGYSSMLKEGDYGKLPEKAAGAVEKVYGSSQRMIKLVNDFLSVSRLETGKTVLKLREASLGELITQTVAELKFKAEEKNLYIKYEQPKTDKIVKVDPEKLKEAISNLIDNSIHYTEKGGITVETKTNGGSRLHIAIFDTGAGMTKEEITKLFESFSRGSAGNELNTQGSGLGLYIAKKFVTMHNGKIWAESEGKNKGSSFHIELPGK